MAEGQIWALGIFAALVLLMAVAMFPRSRRMNGRQKYSDGGNAGRTLFLGLFLLGGDDGRESDAGSSGFDGGGDGGGGE